jgi:hypothetical protein
MLKQFVGDCRTILKKNDVFSDATEMAQVVNRSKRISAELFQKLTGARVARGYSYGVYKSLVWKYNQKNDVHYFYL